MDRNSYSTIFDVHICSNGLLNYSFQCVPFLFVLTLGDVLLGTKHEGSLDADDLMVLRVSFLNVLHLVEKFEISSTFNRLVCFVKIHIFLFLA